MDIEKIKKRIAELKAENDQLEKKLIQTKLKSEYDEINASIIWVNAKCLYQMQQYKGKEHPANFHPTFSEEDEDVLERAINWIIENHRWNDIATLFRRCDWYCSDWCRRAFSRCWEYIPQNELYEITKEIYLLHGYNFPRHTITYLKDLRPDDYLFWIPEEIRNAEFLTVYRASLTDNEDAVRNELSWSLLDSVALDYFDFKSTFSGETGYIYSAKIKPEDVIFSYLEEMEIVQCGDVYDIQCVNPEDIRTSLKETADQLYFEYLENNFLVECSLKRLGKMFSTK